MRNTHVRTRGKAADNSRWQCEKGSVHIHQLKGPRQIETPNGGCRDDQILGAKLEATCAIGIESTACKQTTWTNQGRFTQTIKIFPYSVIRVYKKLFLQNIISICVVFPLAVDILSQRWLYILMLTDVCDLSYRHGPFLTSTSGTCSAACHGLRNDR